MDHTLESLAEEQHVGGGTKEIWKVTIISFCTYFN